MVVVEPVALGQAVNETPVAAEEPPDDEEAEARLENSRWSLHVGRVAPAVLADDKHAQPPTEWQEGGEGTALIEDLSDAAARASASGGQVRWQATVVNRAWTARQTRFVAFVEELSSSVHLDRFREASCSFARSWRAFNQEHQGAHHFWASIACSTLGLTLPLGAAAAYFVFVVRWRHLRLLRSDPSRNTGCGFHFTVILKFFVVDLPQQVCVAVYLFDWFEESGLRCQLCLFHPSRCDKPHPFHFTTLGAIICLVANALSHQLLLKPSQKSLKDGVGPVDDMDAASSRFFGRFVAACTATLPLTTSVLFASDALFGTPTLAKMLVFIPCAAGWATVGCLLLLWVIACCRDG